MNILYYIKDRLKIAKDKDVLNDLYYLKAKVPNSKEINDNISKSDEKIKKYFKKHGIKDGIELIKKTISKIDYKLPLYDVYSDNIYLIDRNNVYNRIINQYYRLPDKKLYNDFVKKRDKMEKTIKTTKKEKSLADFKKTSIIEQKLDESKLRKLNLMIEFLESFDFDELLSTYVQVFYYYANEVGKDITICLRPSFLPHFKHIKPYYSRSELINLGLNMEIIEPSKIYYDSKKVIKLCKNVKKNDITKDIILKHQKHISKENKIGIVQYYSLQGSYFINQYMRDLVPYKYKNELLEIQIKSLWKLINKAPEFNKSYILYRFIKQDDHLKHLKIKDKYIVPGFLSTTRDPFYRSEEYKFGFILIKVKIPADIKGVALCIEPYSHFPFEQEILLSPLSILRLDKKDKNAPYYHTNEIFREKIKTRYEFTYIGKQEIKFKKRSILKNYKLINFLELENEDVLTVSERIKIFIEKYVNSIFQFKTMIGNKEYDIITEWYDSIDVYNKFYSSKTNSGFSMYTLIDNYIFFFIELGEDDGTNETYMYVNYYFKYGTRNKEIILNNNDFIKFISSVSYYFKIRRVIIYSDYENCDFIQKIKYGGNYCIDIYNYLKYNKKRYENMDTITVKPILSYYQLDRLKREKTISILKKDDNDEIYQIHKRVYSKIIPIKEQNLSNFYVWMVDHHCHLIEELSNKMERLYKNNNPFLQDYYILDPGAYLYNNKLITTIPIFQKSVGDTKLQIKKLPKNEYRLERSNNRSLLMLR